MAALVRWNKQRQTWQFVDRPPKGKPETDTLGPTPEDKARGERRAQLVNSGREARRAAGKANALSATGPLYGEPVLRAWWDSAQGSYSDSTVATNEWLLEHHLIPYFKNLNLRTLRREEVKAFGTRCGTPKEEGGGGIGVYAVKGAMGLFTRVMFWCVEGQLLPGFAMQRMTKMAVDAAINAGATKNDREAFTEAEIRKLLEFASPELRLVCFAALQTGARYGELLALTWPCINFDKAEIRIERSQKRPLSLKHRKTPVLDPRAELRRTKVPKNRKVRVIDMSPELSAVLAQARRQQSPFDPDAPTARVFLDERGKPWQYPVLSTRWRACRLRAHRQGVRALPFHSWRHTFVSMGIAAGQELPWIARQIGDTLQTMLDHYAHFIPVKKTERFDFLAGFSVEVPAGSALSLTVRRLPG